MHKYRRECLIAGRRCSIVLLTLFVVASAQAQTSTTPQADNPGNMTDALPFSPRFRFSLLPSGLPLIPANGKRIPDGERIIKELDMAWRASGDGINGRESVVLIFRMEDGNYVGKAQGFTNEFGHFTFKWNPAALAIVHTHPNRADPWPTEQDKRVADKYGVRNITVTIKGMYMYDPATKKTTKVLNGLDWLQLSSYPDGLKQLFGALNRQGRAGARILP